jgi:hypothetical protein
MKYGHIEKTTNKLIGWYDKDIHDNIPVPNIEITDDEHNDYINEGVNYYNHLTKKFEKKDFSTLQDKIKDKLYNLKIKTEKEIYPMPSQALDVEWVGGYESAQMLNAKRLMCLELGLDTCTFTDCNDEDWDLSLDEAKVVCLKVASDFEKRRAEYKQKKRLIESCSTLDELQTITL